MAGLLLVVDDSLTIRKLVELSFRGSAVNVEFAATGREGLAKIDRLHPDAVLLDFVLPDMRGLDVCQRLSESATQPQVLLMSAKHDQVRELFQPYRFVTDFLPKPFAPKDVVERVNGVLGRRSEAIDSHRAEAAAARREGATPVTQAQREVVANALFGALRARLALIPEWAGDLGSQPPARFYAKRLITPELVDVLIEAVAPVVREQLAASGGQLAPAGDVGIWGGLGGMPLADLVAMIAATQRTYELEIDGAVSVFFRAGQIILVTSRDPGRYLADPVVDLAPIDASARKEAIDAQRASGKPVYVTLAEAGCLPDCDLSSVLHEQGKRLLLALMTSAAGSGPKGAARFVGRDLTAVPLYVDAYARALPLVQLSLERFRRDPRAMGDDLPPLRDGTVLERAEGFSERMRSFDLTPSERRALTLVDGRVTVRAIVEKAGDGHVEGMAVLQRLLAVGLVRLREGRPSMVAALGAARRVLIVEPDVEGFQKPLAHLLRSRVDPVELVSLDGEPDLFAVIRRECPVLAVLNATGRAKEMSSLARVVRTSPETRGTPLVAVLDQPDAADVEELSVAGFDAVLAKPVIYSELERLLVA